jgi:hypothetical protein
VFEYPGDAKIPQPDGAVSTEEDVLHCQPQDYGNGVDGKHLAAYL